VSRLCSSVARWCRKNTFIKLEFTIHIIFRYIHMHNSWSSSETSPKSLFHNLWNTFWNSYVFTVFRHRTDNTCLIKALITSSSIRISNWISSRTGDQHHAVSLGILNRHSRQCIRHSRAVTGNAHAYFPSYTRISTCHMHGTRFVSWSNQFNAMFFEIGVHSKVCSINYSEYDCYVFIL